MRAKALRALAAAAMIGAFSAGAALAQSNATDRLSTLKLQRSFSLALPHWQQGVERLLAEILGPQPQAPHDVAHMTART